MARDKYHYQVRDAMVKDGWTITDDPFRLTVGVKDVFMDLGAERLLAAEKDNEKIVVEVKSFPARSFLADFYSAVGKYVTYEDALLLRAPGRKLFLAVPDHIYQAEMYRDELVEAVLQHRHIQVIVVDVFKKIIVKWIK